MFDCTQDQIVMLVVGAAMLALGIWFLSGAEWPTRHNSPRRKYKSKKIMNISVPPFAREHFWEEPPPDSIEFWSFRFKPPCNVGDQLVFRFDGVPVAQAVVHEIQAPGLSACEGTGKFKRGWKVFWRNETFEDLRKTAR